MRTTVRLFGCLLLVFGLGACGSEAESAPPAPPLAIATIQTRDAKISVYGRERELRVSVHRSDGLLVADGLTLAELRVQYPDAYELVTTGYGQNTYLDATNGPVNDKP